MENLKDFLVWVLTPGAGVLAYWLMENVPALVNLDAKLKRFAAFGISALLGILAFLAMVGMGYEAVPVDWRAWVEALFAVAAVAGGLSQVLHGLLKLR
jgi:hypothetical protein